MLQICCCDLLAGALLVWILYATSRWWWLLGRKGCKRYILPYGDTQTGEFIRLLSVLKRSKLKRQSDINKACTWCSRHTGHVAISATISLIPGHGSLTPEKRWHSVDSPAVCYFWWLMVSKVSLKSDSSRAIFYVNYFIEQLWWR